MIARCQMRLPLIARDFPYLGKSNGWCPTATGSGSSAAVVNGRLHFQFASHASDVSTVMVWAKGNCAIRSG